MVDCDGNLFLGHKPFGQFSGRQAQDVGRSWTTAQKYTAVISKSKKAVKGPRRRIVTGLGKPV
jgi:hypothetical protein